MMLQSVRDLAQNTEFISLRADQYGRHTRANRALPTIDYNMDWYRRKSWTKSDQEEFFAKLKKAKKHKRAQYLKIQAIEFRSKAIT